MRKAEKSLRKLKLRSNISRSGSVVERSVQLKRNPAFVLTLLSPKPCSERSRRACPDQFNARATGDPERFKLRRLWENMRDGGKYEIFVSLRSSCLRFANLCRAAVGGKQETLVSLSRSSSRPVKNRNTFDGILVLPDIEDDRSRTLFAGS